MELPSQLKFDGCIQLDVKVGKLSFMRSDDKTWLHSRRSTFVREQNNLNLLSQK